MSPPIVALAFLAARFALQVPVPSAATGPGEYHIGPGDILKVAVFGSEELSQTLVVQPDGTIGFPLVGQVGAAERTPADLATHLAGLLSEGYVRNPQVSVTVQEYRSQRVFVIGEVASPGTYALTGPTSILEILARAGISPAAVGSEVSIIRSPEPVDGPVLPTDARPVSVLTFALADVQSGNLSGNQLLKANDTVLVSPGPRIFVTGEVRSPGSFPYTRGLSARQAIALAGGLTEDGSWKGIRVVRRAGGDTREIKVKPEESVLPGDIIEVRAKLF